MKKILIIGVVVIAILALGGFLYARNLKKDAGERIPTESASDASVFMSAIQSGRPTMCTVEKDADTMEYFIEGNKVRANITNASGISHMISDSKDIYIWTDGQTQGTKMTVPSEEEMKNLQAEAKKYNAAPSLKNEADYNSLTNMGYTVRCQSISVSGSEFTPPENITFQDISAMMKQATPTQEDAADPQKIMEQYKKSMEAQPEENTAY